MVVATPSLALVRAGAKAQRVLAVPSVDAVSATVGVDSVIIRGAYKGVGLIIALDRSRREPGVRVLYYPADLLELSSGVQPEPFGVQLLNQAVAARVSRVPVRVELPT